MESGQTRKRFSMIFLECCDATKGKKVSADRHGTKTQRPCVGGHSTYGALETGTKKSSCVVAQKKETERKIKEL